MFISSAADVVSSPAIGNWLWENGKALKNDINLSKSRCSYKFYYQMLFLHVIFGWFVFVARRVREKL